MSSRKLIRFLGLAVIVGLCLSTQGCRRNLMKISSTPPGAEIYVEGKPVRVEDSDLRMQRRVDAKKNRGKTLTAEEQDWDSRRRQFQTTPLEYEFRTIGAGYQLYCTKPGYQPATQVVFIEPRWYEYPPIDIFVDLLPFTVTDTREFSFDLVPEKKEPPQS